MPVAGLPPITLPKKLGGVARTAGPAAAVLAGQRLSKDNINRSNTTLASYRHTRSAPALMRQLFASNGLLSTAVLNLVSMADSGYQIEAYETFSQEFSREGLLAAETVISGLDTTWDYSKGYTERKGVPALVESQLLEVALTGGLVAELVLDKYRLPNRIVLSPYDEMYWISNGKGGSYPQQKPPSGEAIDLNYPTIFVAESSKSAAEKYATPFIAAGAQSLWNFTSTLEDAWRTIRVAGEPRLTAKIDYEQVVRSAPPEIQGDPAKLTSYLEDTRASVETLLKGLSPEDALVFYSLVEMGKIDSSNEKRDFATLIDTHAGISASALKSNASLLGLRLGGSQSVASVEAVLSTKIARRLQLPVEEVMSRALTLAVRLLGIDCYIKFVMKPIELRPESELAAHRAMDSNRILELLSLGRLNDDEAQKALGLGSLPESAQVLSGTGFYASKALDTVPASGGNSVNNQIKVDGPASAGGTDQEQRT